MSEEYKDISIKFIEVLSGLSRAGLTSDQYDYLTKYMNLSQADIDEIIKVADNVWNANKAS